MTRRQVKLSGDWRATMQRQWRRQAEPLGLSTDANGGLHDQFVNGQNRPCSRRLKPKCKANAAILVLVAVATAFLSPLAPIFRRICCRGLCVPIRKGTMQMAATAGWTVIAIYCGMLKFMQRARNKGAECHGKNRQHPTHLLKLRKR